MADRNICEVIKRVIAELPASEYLLMEELGDISDSALYTAPEVMWERWGQVAHTLEFHLNDPNSPDAEEYERKIARIIAGVE